MRLVGLMVMRNDVRAVDEVLDSVCYDVVYLCYE